MKRFNYLYLLGFGIFNLNMAICFAADVAPPSVMEHARERSDAQRLQQDKQMETMRHSSNLYDDASPINSTESENHTISLSKEEVLQHPDLLNQAMASALSRNEISKVVFLYPIYSKLPEHQQDAFMKEWATAIYARSQQRHGDAIRHYRHLIADHNDAILLRFQLAQALFENNELVAAEDQFRKLASEGKDNAEFVQVINEYLAAIQRRKSWNFSGSMTYIQDENINTAPSNWGTETYQYDEQGNPIISWKGSTDKPESAAGVSFNFGAEKQWNHQNGVFNHVQANTSGKYYWNNKRFNEVTARIGTGMGYQDVQNRVAITPFMEQTWYAGGSREHDTVRRFSRGAGISVDAHRWLNQQWQILGNYEYNRQRYRTRHHLNGHSHLWSTTAVYYRNAKQYWFAGADYLYNKARDEDNAYTRPSVRVGWGQEWGKGLSTRLSLSYGHRVYKGVNLFNSKQKNHELSSNISIWHRSVHLWGITPRLTWNYNRTKSNQNFYTYHKNRIFMDFTKNF